MNIKTWQERHKPGIRAATDPTIAELMQSEIDELRAALKAQPVQPALKELSDAEIDTVTVAHFRKPILPMFRGFARSIWNLRAGGAG